MELNDLEIYRLSREISKDIWCIYNRLNWEDRKVVGYQCISACDSVGANIAEGFGRYHYLDKNKFNFNSRGSLLETIHWVELLKERSIIEKSEYDSLIGKLTKLHIKLNNYISSTRKLKENK